MAILNILHYPDPVLKKKSDEVKKFDKTLKKLVKDMLDTMRSASGVGLAAPQVAVSSRLIMIDLSCKDEEENVGTLVMVNPSILESEGSWGMEEGCLSVPDITVDVKRARKIKARFQDVNGGESIIECEDILARVILHEIDHLDGIIILDRIGKLKGDFYKRQLNKRYKKEQCRPRS